MLGLVVGAAPLEIVKHQQDASVINYAIALAIAVQI